MLPWSQLPTYIFVAFFVLVVVFVAVPAREEEVRAGKRDCIDSVHVPADSDGAGQAGGEERPLQLGRGPSWLLISVRAVLRLLQRWESRADLLLSHLCVLQDVDIDEESLFVLSHAPQQESSFF